MFADIPEVEEETGEPCTALSVEDGLCIMRTGMGLQTNVKPGALVAFSGGATGLLLVWKESIGLVQIVEGTASAGESLKATARLMITEASAALRGRIIYPTGSPADGRPLPPVPANPRLTFADFKGMHERTNQYRACFTGVLGVDFSVPVGRGQTMLFQGTDAEKDKENLWPDLMAIKPGPNATPGPSASVCVCRSLEEAERLKGKLEERGEWDHCVIVVPDTSGPGGLMIAMNAAVALAEELNDEDGEVTVMLELEPMHQIFNLLAEAAGEERRAKGIMADPEDDVWTEMEGTVLRESIAERRKFWFALISRATNSLDAGSVTLLTWLWEQEGGFAHRSQKAYLQKIEQIKEIPRIDDYLRDKMIDKIMDEARAAGVAISEDGSAIPEPSLGTEGVPNWEIEELKSITDGHILLKPSPEGEPYSWRVDPYKSLPRLGTDALHPALISIGAHKLRLKMLQARDRAVHLQDTLGSPCTLDKESIELTFAELITEQPAGKPLSVEEQIAQITVVSNPNCKPLRAAGGCNTEKLAELSSSMLQSGLAERIAGDVEEKGEVTPATQILMKQVMDKWEA